MSGQLTVVHLVRHGEVHNPDGILYGRLPGYGLSTVGQQMADVLGEHFADRDVAALIASPLERAQQTAAPIARTTGLDVSSDERLVEADNRFEGQRWGVREGIMGRPRNWPLLRNPLRPSWGEAYVDIALRMAAAVESARVSAYGHEAVCVSHQLPIWVMHQGALGRRLWHDPRSRVCALASVTSLHFEGTELTDVGYVEPYGDVGGGVGA